MDVPPHLILSALTWYGSPYQLTDDDHYHTVYIGTYAQPKSAPVQLHKGQWNATLGAVEYILATPLTFKYSREVSPGLSSEVIAVDMSPVLRVCLPDRLPWPETFKPSKRIDRPLDGPPFRFYSSDWEGGHGIDPDLTLFGVYILQPDLPGQNAANPWRGAWAALLLEKQERGEPLGVQTQIIWDIQRRWAVEVHLEAMEVIENEDDSDEDDDEDEEYAANPRSLASYDVRATVLRVFVTTDELVQLQEPEAEDESEEEDAFSDDSTDV